ncbi:MAG: hypothetical protein HDS71_07505 [Bacteroidales bacterium]|nr:hypothetical protein [Bacteroidales bacterium]
MEISVKTRLRSDRKFAFDLHIEDMCVDTLPSFNVDQIREMVRPQIESIIRDLGCKNGEYIKKVSCDLVYGTEQSESTSQADIVSQSDSEKSDVCPTHQ